MKSLFGVMGVFATPEAAKRAAIRLRDSGFRRFEAYTPYPVEDLNRIIHPGPKFVLPVVMFVAAVLGAIGGYWIQYWD
jgi:hypothetical protein